MDVAEDLAIARAKELFGAAYANVQPHSGSQANVAVFTALLEPGDTILGMSLAHGGHLTHGAKPNFSGRFYHAVQYGLDLDSGEIDYDQVEALAKEHRPKLIMSGFSAYPRTLDFARLAEIARPRVGIVTNVAPAHLESMRDLGGVARAKAELVAALPLDGTAVLNADDARVRSMADKTSARTFTFGLTPGCDLWADEIESLGLEGIRLRMHAGPGHAESIPVRLPMAGRHSAYTALGAAAAGLVEGLAWPEIVEGLRAGRPLRLTPVPAVNPRQKALAR